LIENQLVPKHELLDKETSENILKKYGVTRDEMPKIKASDPALGKLKADVGDIIKITRKNPFIGDSYHYRVVIEG